MKITKKLIHSTALSMCLLTTACLEKKSGNPDNSFAPLYDKIIATGNPASSIGHFYPTKEGVSKEDTVNYITSVETDMDKGRSELCFYFTTWDGDNDHDTYTGYYCRPIKLVSQPNGVAAVSPK